MSEYYTSYFWQEIADTQDEFVTSEYRCHGYDVFGDLLGKASLEEYWYLLLTGQRPSRRQSRLLQDLAIALANAGPRDHSVLAAMNAGMSGSTSASCLMAALAVGAGQYNGAREIYHAIALWQHYGTDPEKWKAGYQNLEHNPVWKEVEHIPGFNPYIKSCPLPVLQSLDHLTKVAESGALQILQQHRTELEQAFNASLSLTGVAAAALHDLSLDQQTGEMLYLILRLPGAAVHALEQRRLGWRHFPFYPEGIRYANKESQHEDSPA